MEDYSEEELAQKTIKKLEKAVDLDYFGQVCSPAPRHLGESASSSTVHQQPAQAAGQVAAIAKGKEIQQEEQLPNLEQQEEMAEQPTSTDQQTQGQAPPMQEAIVEITVLQTPANEERMKKRDRQEETPLTASTDQPGEKRQRLNPFSEEEMPKRPIGGMIPPSMEASASSFQQEQERQQGAEVSSSGQQTRPESNIKKQFIDVKARNEVIRYQLYNQLLRMAPTNQQRLMAAYDIQEGKMTLSHFRCTMQQP